jgi:phosphatidylserine/phosphatidylglycerophosphate/cardiolipin synthase-like enzyme
VYTQQAHVACQQTARVSAAPANHLEAQAMEKPLSLERATERLLEDERLRSDLTDDEAQVLLDWAIAELNEADKRGEPLDDALARIRATGREVNDLVGGRHDIDAPTFARRLRLLARLPDPGPLDFWRRWVGQGDPVDALMDRLPSLDGPSLVREILALLPSAAGAGRQPARGGASTGRLLSLVLIALGVILIGVVVYGVNQAGRQAPPVPVPKQPVPPAKEAPKDVGSALGGLVTVSFTDPKDPDRPQDRHGGLDESLTAFVNEATTSVDMAIYDLDLENVTAALIDAGKRGVRVRVITDTDNLKNEPIEQLKAAKIPVVEDKRSAIMHHKFTVVDGASVWMGSWNFTVYDTYRYNNNGALWRSRPLAEKYTVEFEQLFEGKIGASTRKAKSAADVVVDAARDVRIEAYFTPEDNPAPEIVKRVEGARTSVLFLAYSFTDNDIGAAMLARHRAGVQVRGVFERTGSETSSSEFGRLKQAGADVLQDGNRYLMHHKVIVIDERTVVFGSYNFSASAQDNNENLLIVDSPELAKLFVAEFAKVYDKAAAAR